MSAVKLNRLLVSNSFVAVVTHVKTVFSRNSVGLHQFDAQTNASGHYSVAHALHYICTTHRGWMKVSNVVTKFLVFFSFPSLAETLVWLTALEISESLKPRPLRR